MRPVAHDDPTHPRVDGLNIRAVTFWPRPFVCPLWERRLFSLVTHQWQVHPSRFAPARVGACVAATSGRAALLIGGRTNEANESTPTFFADVWTFTIENGWRLSAPTDGVAPTARAFATLVPVATTVTVGGGRPTSLVLFGGEATPTLPGTRSVLDDVWIYTVADNLWTHPVTTGPVRTRDAWPNLKLRRFRVRFRIRRPCCTLCRGLQVFRWRTRTPCPKLTRVPVLPPPTLCSAHRLGQATQRCTLTIA